MWLSAMIIETEAYYRDEKASHASLGFTEKTQSVIYAAGYYLHVLCAWRWNFSTLAPKVKAMQCLLNRPILIIMTLKSFQECNPTILKKTTQHHAQ